jgi:hypothetical protein
MHIQKWIISLIAAGQLVSLAAAQEVAYTWVDNNGVTHFSDVPPAARSAAAAGVVTMDMPQDFTSADPENDYYSIANQWKRAQQERVEKDKLALLREQLRIERLRAEQEIRAAEAREVAGVATSRTPLIIVRDDYPVPGRTPIGQRGFSYRTGSGSYDIRPGYRQGFGFSQHDGRRHDQSPRLQEHSQAAQKQRSVGLSPEVEQPGKILLNRRTVDTP